MIKPKFIYSVCYIVIAYYLTACAVATSIEAGFDSLAQSFSEADEINTAADDMDSSVAMRSTHNILESQSELELEDNATHHLSTIRIFDNVWQRIPSLYQLSDIDNSQIRVQLKWYLKHKQYIERISKRADPFLYLITDEVEKRNIPGEIALLPIVESAFITDAHSRKKASGLWQFMPSTGRYFGLKQNWWYDGRRDIYMSTNAALTYLSQLNKYYKGDWLLTLAAYNAGSGNVDKAIRKNKKRGLATDYWSLDLPKETRRYIPKLLAIAKLIQHPGQYHLSLYPIKNKAYLQLVNIQSQTDLSVLASLADISIKTLKTYNPAFKQWTTAPDGPHHLLLPINKVSIFENQLALLSPDERIKTYRHKIRSGENLGLIAQRYNTSIKALKKTNHLKSNRIRAGKYLLVPSSSQTMLAQQQTIDKVVKQSKGKKNNTGGQYTVRQGDSFWTIARRYNLSHKKLAKINGLSSAETLSIGQKLVIPTTTNKTQLISYQVKRGDSLYLISKRFNVSIKNLKKWNKINRRNLLHPGQRLKVYQQVI